MLSRDYLSSRGPLFNLPPSRKSDPETSVQAAQKLQRSGKWRGQKQRVFEALRRNPGSTSAELAEFMGGDRYIPSRRLPDLARVGMVKKGKVRLCQATNSKCVTWWPNSDYDGPLLYESTGK